MAARFTEERHDNFDIYLPLWLARHNMPIFGVLSMCWAWHSRTFDGARADAADSAVLDANPMMNRRNLQAALLYFALVMGTGFALGCVRVPLLAPRVGERYAELIEMPFMLAAIVFAARYVVRRFALSPRPGIRLQVGFVALAMSVVAELMLAAVLQGRSVAAYIANRDPVSGLVYLVMLTMFALMPRILAYRGTTYRPPR